jgi:hypothetical protein
MAMAAALLVSPATSIPFEVRALLIPSVALVFLGFWAMAAR